MLRCSRVTFSDIAGIDVGIWEGYWVRTEGGVVIVGLLHTFIMAVSIYSYFVYLEFTSPDNLRIKVRSEGGILYVNYVFR